MKRAMERADLILAKFAFDPETSGRLKAEIVQAVLDERRTVNNEIQHRLSNIKVSVAEDLDRVRKEIEVLLHPTPIL